MANYVLVLLEDVPGVEPDDEVSQAHEDFIDSLIARNAVLLGGPFEGDVAGASGAYLLACPLDRARALAAEDPLVRTGVNRARLVPWELVGINPDAVHERLVVRPGDVAG